MVGKYIAYCYCIQYWLLLNPYRLDGEMYIAGIPCPVDGIDLEGESSSGHPALRTLLHVETLIQLSRVPKNLTRYLLCEKLFKYFVGIDAVFYIFTLTDILLLIKDLIFYTRENKGN